MFDIIIQFETINRLYSNACAVNEMQSHLVEKFKKCTFEILMIYFFLLSLTYRQRQYCFRSNFENRDFDGFACFEVPWVLKSHFQRLVYVYVCLCVCAFIININQKQSTAESSNLALYICSIRRCYLKNFIKIEQKFCVQVHIKVF